MNKKQEKIYCVYNEYGFYGNYLAILKINFIYLIRDIFRIFIIRYIWEKQNNAGNANPVTYSALDV